MQQNVLKSSNTSEFTKTPASLEMSPEERQLIVELVSRPIWLAVIESSVTVLNIIAALLGNLLVCVAVYRKQRLRTLSNYYLIALAVSDILMSAIIFPMVLQALMTGEQPFGNTSCKFQATVATFLGGVSFSTITLTSINRYFRMVRPNLYRKYFNRRTVFISIVTFWVIGAYLPITLFLTDIGVNFHPGKLICLYEVDKMSLTQFVDLIICSFILQYVIVILCYFRVYVKIKKHNKIFVSFPNESKNFKTNTRLNVKEIKISKMLFAIVAGFSFCWLPYIVIDLLEFKFGQFRYPRQIYLLDIYMAGYSSAINPWIYGVMNREFRREFKDIVGRIFGKKFFFPPADS